MKRIVNIVLLLIILGVLSGCALFQENNECTIEVNENVENSGTLYRTYCVSDSKNVQGLVNSDFEIVIPEIYTRIDSGIDLYVDDTIDFSNDIEYFRVAYYEDGDYKQGVIDRNNNLIVEFESYSKIIISNDANKIYSYENQGTIYDIQSGLFLNVEYRIIRKSNDYYIAMQDDKQIVLNKSFDIVFDDNYDEVLSVSDESIIYKKDHYMYAKDLESNIVVDIFDVSIYPDYIYMDDFDDYFLINPNSDVIFADIKDGTLTNIDDCSSILNFEGKYITMFCSNNYKVFTKDNLTPVLEIPLKNTDIIPLSATYIQYVENDASIRTVGKIVDFDSQIQSYELFLNRTIEVHFEEQKTHYDVETLEELFSTNLECEIVPNNMGANLVITNKGCSVSDISENITVLSLSNTRISITNLEIYFYTDEYIFLNENGKTIIVDYDLNILFWYWI